MLKEYHIHKYLYYVHNYIICSEHNFQEIAISLEIANCIFEDGWNSMFINCLKYLNGGICMPPKYSKTSVSPSYKVFIF